MISLRLNNELENKLEQIAKNENLSKSEIVKRALIFYFDDYNKKHSPYDLGKDLFGQFGSNMGNLSRDYKKILKGKLSEKYNR